VVANIGGGLDPNNGMQHLIQGDGVGAFLASVQAANPDDESAGAESSQSTQDIPQPDFGGDESKDDNKMEE